MKGKPSAPTRWIADAIKKMSKNSQEKVKFIYATGDFTKHAINIKPKALQILFQPDQNEKHMLSPIVTLVVRYGIVI